MAYDPTHLVHAARLAIGASPARPLTEIAAACSVSRKTLERAFQRSGTARAREVREHVLQQTLSETMTTVPPLSIKAISVRLGFSSPQAFARWVKRENGVIPTALRARLCERLPAEAGPAFTDGRLGGSGSPITHPPGTPEVGRRNARPYRGPGRDRSPAAAPPLEP